MQRQKRDHQFRDRARLKARQDSAAVETGDKAPQCAVNRDWQ
jgi:hypothetical protein